MSKLVNFEYHSRCDEAEALKLVSFPVERKPIYFNDGGKEISLDREVLYRSDTGFQFEIVSSGYSIIKHNDALKTTLDALRKLNRPFKIMGIGLDRDGAKMFVRFQFEHKNDLGIKPELILLNSYDGGMAVGLDLGASLGDIQFYIADQARWPHVGQLDLVRMEKEAKAALELFDTEFNWHLVLKKQVLNQTESLETVKTAIKDNVIPQKLGPLITQKIVSERVDNRWGLLLTYCSVVSKMNVSPTRKRELLQNIHRRFQWK